VSEETQPSRRSSSLVPGEDRRRSQRVVIRIPVLLHVTLADVPADLPAETMSVNEQGALLLCPKAIPDDTRFEIEHKRTGVRQGCRVVRAPREVSGGFHVPIEFDAPAKSFWQIAFPRR
jgi:hypothetical protein